MNQMMVPVMNLVNNYIEQIFCSSAVSQELKYKGVNLDTEVLRSEINSIVDFSQPCVQKKLAEQFLWLLPYFKLFEQGGLESLNLKLNQLLSELQYAEDEELNSKVKAFNELLASAIYICPHLAKSVQVRVKESLKKRISNGRLVSAWFDDEDYLDAYLTLELFQAQRDMENNNQLFFPLPHQAEFYLPSQAHIGISLMRVQNGFIPILACLLRQPFDQNQPKPNGRTSSFRHTIFPVLEIMEINFSVKEEYTSYVVNSENLKSLDTRGNALYHYLKNFCRFTNFNQNRRYDLDYPEIDTQALQSLRQLHEPNWNSSFWSESVQGDDRCIELGFLACLDNLPVIYEITNWHLPAADIRDSKIILMHKILKQELQSGCQVKKIKGNNIFLRLMQVI